MSREMMSDQEQIIANLLKQKRASGLDKPISVPLAKIIKTPVVPFALSERQIGKFDGTDVDNLPGEEETVRQIGRKDSTQPGS